MNLKSLILLFGLVALAYVAKAQQSNCAFKLQEAESLYEAGILDSIPAMLRPCLSDGFDDEELARAYKLLIRTYLFEDYEEMAELTMLKFLKKFPEYEIKPTDPVEFNYLFKSYQTIPSFSIGVIIGGNYTYNRILKPFSVYDNNNYKGDYTSAGLNFSGGLQIKKYITENIDINLDVIYSLKSFSYILNELDSKITYDETQSMLSFPLSGTYDFKLGKISPYARLGVNVDYLLSASADGSRIISSNGVDDVKETGIDIMDNRKPYYISAILGGGVKWNTKKGYAMIDIRYHMGFSNYVVGENRYSIKELWSDVGYVDDDFSMSNLYISAGYVFSFYKTKNNRK